MRSYAMGLLLTFIFIIGFTWSIGFVQDNVSMRENKNESWKEYLYLGSNKGYTRTMGFDMSKLTLNDLYTNIMPDDIKYTGDALYYEMMKDIADNSLYGSNIYFRVYLADDKNKPTFFVVRRVGDQTNVMKIELKEGK